MDSIDLKNLIIENSKLDVIHGNDIYQSELSCQFTERQFRHERGSEVSYIKIDVSSCSTTDLHMVIGGLKPGLQRVL